MRKTLLAVLIAAAFIFATAARSTFMEEYVADNITTNATNNSHDAGTISTTETAFASVAHVTGGSLDTNRAFQLCAGWEAITPASGTTFRLRLRWGGVSGPILFDTGAISVGNNQTVRAGSCYLIQGTDATSSSASVETTGLGGNSGGASLLLVGNTVAQPVAVNTSTASDLTFTIQFGAGTAGNILKLRQLAYFKP